MDFSIIIINYNLSNEVKNCINSIIQFIDNSNFEIILVDNNSHDKSVLKLVDALNQNSRLKFLFIQMDKNIGFGNACNLAAKKSSGNWLLFLNPDTLIKDNIFQRMKYELNGNFINKGIIGLNVNCNKLMDFSAGFFPNYILEVFNIFLLGRYLEAIFVRIISKFSRTKKIRVEWVMGAALFINRYLFEEIKGFDQDYFLFFEEMDLCKRVINKGFPVTYLANIKISHLGGASAKRNYYFLTKMFYKGKLLFLKKHSSKSAFDIYKIILFFTIINQIIFWLLNKLNNKEKAFGKIKAFREILKNLSTPEEITNLS